MSITTNFSTLRHSCLPIHLFHRSRVLDTLVVVLLVAFVAYAIVEVIIAAASGLARRVLGATVVAFVVVLDTILSFLVVLVDTDTVVKGVTAVASRLAIRVLRAAVVVEAHHHDSTTNTVRRRIHILCTGRGHYISERQESQVGDAQITKAKHGTNTWKRCY
jgi:hypothetical protein